MRLSWFKNPDNIVYADAEEFMDNFSKETGIEDLRQQIEAFYANPTKEGLQLKGVKRTAVKVFIPDLVFDEHIEMGENVWLYMGENYECYCLYNIGGHAQEPKEYKFHAHKACEFFPCHETNDPDNFNCLFCYCPLYAMGRECGGNFSYMENGIKDCSACLVPHKRDNYDYMVKKINEFYKTLQEKELAERDK